jgi:hypothetical protein
MELKPQPDTRGLVPGIHVLLWYGTVVDGRDEPGHDVAI